MFLGAGNDIRDLITMGPRFIFQGAIGESIAHRGPPVIGLDRGYHPSGRHNGIGYDGQFSYYIAVSPQYARFYMDEPSYRYSRILAPILARELALGQRSAIPYTLLALNLFGAALGTWALAVWLLRRGCSRWFALIYGLFPGVFIGVQRDVSEPLAYGLVALGLLLFDAEAQWALVGSAVVFALAGLARDTTLVFPLVLAIWMAFGGTGPRRSGSDRWRALALLSISFVPSLAWLTFLRVWLGSFGGAEQLTPITFAGIVTPSSEPTYLGLDIVLVALPALLAVVLLRPQPPIERARWVPWLLFFANVLLSIVFFAKFSQTTYPSVVRVATGVALSAVLCAPYLREFSHQRRRWLAATVVIALAPFPAVAVEGFISLAS